MGLPQVIFAEYNQIIASTRLRATIPQQEVAKLGIERGRDILVYGKHLAPMSEVKKFRIAVYDICDDHFHTLHEDYYREHSANADLITVNSETMRDTVSRETGRESVVIPDPYESEERLAGMGEGLLWYGHQSNLKQIEPYLDLNPVILTGEEWSREKQLAALKACAVVLIPTDDRKCKSANRLIEAVRNGRFVVAGDLPAHDEFKPYMWVGDIREGVEWALSHPNECREKVIACQEYIRDKFSPAAIGKRWAEVLEATWQQATAH